jgi:hypothetical protein
MVDENGEWFFVALSALMGAWFGGASQNNWDFNVTNWKFDKDTYWGMGIGGILGGGLGYLSELGKLPLKMSFNYRNKPLLSLANFGKGNNELALLGSTLLGGTTTALGGAKGNNQNEFVATVDIGVSISFPPHRYRYEGVPITYYNVGPYGHHYLPDASFFKSPQTGGISWINAEYWIYKYGGADVPWWGDPVNFSAAKFGSYTHGMISKAIKRMSYIPTNYYLMNKINTDDAIMTAINVLGVPGGQEPFTKYWYVNQYLLALVYKYINSEDW